MWHITRSLEGWYGSSCFPDLFRWSDVRRVCFIGERGGRLPFERSHGFGQPSAAASGSRGCARKRAAHGEARNLGGEPALLQALSLRRRTSFLPRHSL